MKRRFVDLVGKIAPAVETVSRAMSRVAAVIERHQAEKSQAWKIQMLEKQIAYYTKVGIEDKADELTAKWIQELETPADTPAKAGQVVQTTPVNPVGVAFGGTAPQAATYSPQSSDVSKQTIVYILAAASVGPLAPPLPARFSRRGRQTGASSHGPLHYLCTFARLLKPELLPSTEP